MGDVTLEIKERKPFGGNLLISYVFNTAFPIKSPEESRLLTVGLREMSPLGKQKQKEFGSNFSI